MLKTIKLNWKPGDYFEDLRQIGACLDNPRKKLGPVSFSLELLSVQKKKKKWIWAIYLLLTVKRMMGLADNDTKIQSI